MVPAAEQGDEDPRGRSERSSFSPRRLRQAVEKGLITPDQKAFAEQSLSLAGNGGQDRLLYPTDPKIVTDASRLDATLDALRKAAGRPRDKVSVDLADSTGTVAASLLRIARLWSDDELARQAGEVVDGLERFRTKGRVRHSLRMSSENVFLGDALAYCDATLQDYIANGRVPSLERGTEALRETLRLFGDGNGLLRPSSTALPLNPPRAVLPQATDDEREATSAAALRLLDAYATVLGPRGNDFRRAADLLYVRLGAVAEALPAMGGTLAALARHQDRRAVLVIGEDAINRSIRLTRALANRLVVPVLGPARPDLSGRPNGLYIATPTSVTGPFAEAELLRRLPRSLELGL
jgi:uncharacterized protein YyaL (SSP411 family)